MFENTLKLITVGAVAGESCWLLYDFNSALASIVYFTIGISISLYYQFLHQFSFTKNRGNREKYFRDVYMLWPITVLETIIFRYRLGKARSLAELLSLMPPNEVISELGIEKREELDALLRKLRWWTECEHYLHTVKKND